VCITNIEKSTHKLNICCFDFRKKHETSRRKKREEPDTTSDEEEDRRKKKKKSSHKKKKSKRKHSRSSSSGSEEEEYTSSASASTGSSSSQESDSGVSESYRGAMNKGKKRSKADRIREDIDWDLLNYAWPIEDRPYHLRKKKNVRGRDIDALVRLKKEVVGEEEKKELGDSAFCRDAVVKTTKYKAAKDDGHTRLHPARSARQPLVIPSKWFGKTVPLKRTVIVRHFPLDHYGAGGQVSDKTLGKLHNRAVDVPFEHFCQNNNLGGKEAELTLKQLEQGAHNYSAVLHALWPQDYSGLVLHRILAEARWGEATGLDDK